MQRILTLILSTLLFTSTTTNACTRVLHVEDQAVMVGRNMDWKENLHPDIVIFPRGEERLGSFDENPLTWTSRYGNVVTTSYGLIPSDGMNEKGLAAHILWLDESDYGKQDPNKPSLSVVMWLQYYLDNFASVDEAVRFTEANPLQVAPYYHSTTKKWLNLHLILDDASGDSAILEYTDGKLHIFHDKNYISATNDPTYDKQIANLKQYKVFGGDKPLPGTNEPTDRFVRATYYTQMIPASDTIAAEVASVLSVINNTAQTYTKGTPDKPHMSSTLWHTVLDLTHRVYYFQSTTSQHLISISLDKFNLKEGSPVLFLDLEHHPEYVDDVTDKFTSL